MALVLNYTSASSNLPAFLDNWVDNFEYRGTGGFNAVRNVSDQAGMLERASSVVWTMTSRP